MDNFKQVVSSFDSAIFQIVNIYHSPTGISEFTCFLCLALCSFLMIRFHKRYDFKILSKISLLMLMCVFYAFFSYLWDNDTDRGRIIISHVDESVWAFMETIAFSLGMLFVLELHVRITTEIKNKISEVILCRKNVLTFSCDEYMLVDDSVVRIWEKKFVKSFTKFCWLMIYFNIVLLIMCVIRSVAF